MSGCSALWQRNPEVLRNQVMPEGFAGFCSRCGKPGHVTHNSSSAGTEVWCERCYPVVARRIWLKQVGLCALALLIFWGLKHLFV